MIDRFELDIAEKNVRDAWTKEREIESHIRKLMFDLEETRVEERRYIGILMSILNDIRRNQ